MATVMGTPIIFWPCPWLFPWAHKKFTILSIGIILQEWKVTIIWTTIENNSFQAPKLFNGEALWKPLILCIAMVAKDGRKGQIGNCTCNCLVQQENVYPWFHINVRFISVNSNSIFSKQVIIPQISHSPFSSFQQYFFSQLLVFAGVDSCDFCLNIILQCTIG